MTTEKQMYLLVSIIIAVAFAAATGDSTGFAYSRIIWSE